MNRRSIIYGRVSSTSDRQNTGRQTYSLTKLIDANNDLLVHEPFLEHISGATPNKDRPVFLDCLNYAKDNAIDVIYFSSMDRMGRAIWEVLESIKFCLDNKINCIFQKEGMSLYLDDGTENPFLAIFCSVISTCAKVERDSIKFRLNDARRRKIELALSNGKTLADVGFGRPKGSVKTKEKKEQEYAATIKALKRGLSLRDAAKISNVSVSTCQRIKKEFCL